MGRVDPVYLFRRLHRLNIEVNNDGLLVVAHDDAAERFVLAGIRRLDKMTPQVEATQAGDRGGTNPAETPGFLTGYFAYINRSVPREGAA